MPFRFTRPQSVVDGERQDTPTAPESSGVILTASNLVDPKERKDDIPLVGGEVKRNRDGDAGGYPIWPR